MAAAATTMPASEYHTAEPIARKSRDRRRERQVGDLFHWPSRVRPTIFLHAIASGSPSSPSMARIVLKDLETEKAQSVPETEASIGRDPSCAFVVEGPKSKVVSGRH